VLEGRRSMVSARSTKSGAIRLDDFFTDWHQVHGSIDVIIHQGTRNKKLENQTPLNRSGFKKLFIATSQHIKIASSGNCVKIKIQEMKNVIKCNFLHKYCQMYFHLV